jgi:Zn-dependent protease with chaperone function
VVAEWLREAKPFSAQEGFRDYPVFEIQPTLPALTVAGVREPRVLVSRAAARLLEAREMRTALQHEVAHIRHRDNLKKLFFNFTAFPGMSGLEAAWSDAGEFAADDAAVSTASDALDLASALIKLSRLGPITETPELATALVEGQNATLNSRVARLLAWQQDTALPPEPMPWFVVTAGIAFTVAVVASYSTVLEGIHEVTEWLVR